MERARDVHQRVFEDALHAGGAVREAPALGGLEVDRVVGVARRPEQIDEPRGDTSGVEVVWNSKYSGTRAKPPSGVRRITLRTCSVIVGRPYAARPMTLYSSSLTAKPR